MTTALKRRRGHTRLSANNQVTLPKAVVDALGLEPGAELRVEARDGEVALVPVEDLLARRRRLLDSIDDRFRGLYPPGYLDELRDQWG
ncbi:MAG: AbrB/MazE/SpoVT family DNA-binding domain-containing protein [Chloroflexi bacterium]|nr:AbrB/MazE/SpoVT family DNA-binding domain-containing protein [Chloroflexota bacterium]